MFTVRRSVPPSPPPLGKIRLQRNAVSTSLIVSQLEAETQWPRIRYKLISHFFHDSLACFARREAKAILLDQPRNHAQHHVFGEHAAKARITSYDRKMREQGLAHEKEGGGGGRVEI